MAAILPTKSNLMNTKRSRALAQTGFELMDKKRNILIREMMSLIDDAAEVQSKIDTVFRDAYTSLREANVKIGIVDHIAEAVALDETLDIQYRSVMGVEIPHIPDHSPPVQMEYGFYDTCSALDQCYIRFHEVKSLVRQLAEIETSIYRLATAIKKTQKRANALQNIVIPNFDHTIDLITNSLAEKEREEFVKQKVIKQQSGK